MKEDIIKRQARALELVDGPKVKHGVVPILMEEFEISERTAQYDIHAARGMMAEQLVKKVDRARLRIVAQLENVIWECPPTSPVHLAAIGKMIDLLGVAAPSRIEATVETNRLPDPLAKYKGRPDLLEAALRIDHEAEYGRPNPVPLKPGEDCRPGLAIPGSSNGNGNGRSRPPQQPDEEPPHS